MRIKKVELTNFRPYRDVTFDFNESRGTIHIIEGGQGAGKTSFQEAIKWALYGGDGRVSNYKRNWNQSAKEEGDEEMSVRLEFDNGETDHTLERRIRRFNHSEPAAYEELVLYVGGEEPLEGEDAREYIDELLPEQLQDYFFLDGERIQALIGEEQGIEVREDIERVLKHDAIIYGRDDLKDTLKEYKKERNEIEEEIEEAEEVEERLKEKRQERDELEEEIEELDTEIEAAEERIEEAEKQLDDYEENVKQEIDEIDDELQNLRKEKRGEVRSAKGSWEKAYVGVVSDIIDNTLADLEDEVEHFDRHLSDMEKRSLLRELQQQATNERCPICGAEEVTNTPSIDSEHQDGSSREEIVAELNRSQRQLRILKEAERPESSPDPHLGRIDELERKISQKETEKENLLSQRGGMAGEGRKNELEDLYREAKLECSRLEDKQRNKGERLAEIEDKISNLRDEQREFANDPDLDKVEGKIRAANRAIQLLDQMREEHIKKKRNEIRKEMNTVFDQVAVSEFVSTRYEGVDFMGDIDQDESFVLVLLLENDETQDMEYHPPSAGEAQLTALSFIFGLSKFAKYTTTIVFDTVAGRLDKANSKAQGEYFTNLDEPIILLVHDGEFDKLEPAIKDDIGHHYKLVSDEDANTSKEEVTH